MDLPSWIDIGKISGIGVLVLSIVQYTKKYFPEKWIPAISIVIGILVSIAAECCQFGEVKNWVQTIVNGVLAAVLADTGYSFLSGKGGGNLQLPSK